MMKGNRTWEILNMLKEQGQPMNIRRVTISQGHLSEKLGISRQALNVHLKKMKDEGLIDTGRGFIDIIEKDAKPKMITIVNHIDISKYLE